MCPQEKFCIIKIIKIVNGIYGTKPDSLNLLEIDKIYILGCWGLTSAFKP